MLLKKLQKACKILFFGAFSSWSVYRSGLFDGEYYRRENICENIPSLFALLHYLFIGYRQRLPPSPYFVPNYYYSQIEFLATERVEPIFHFITTGWKRGVKPNPFFETSHFSEFKSTVTGRKYSNPLSWYLKEEEAKRIAPCNIFDGDYYAKRYQNVQLAEYDSWSHFLYFGEKEGLCPHGSLENWFEFCWFEDRKLRFYEQDQGVLLTSFETDLVLNLSQNPVVDPIYLIHNFADTELDIKNINQVLAELQVDDSVKPCEWFDPVYYREKNLDNVWPGNPVLHYIREGVYKGFFPNEEVAGLSNKPLISIIVPVYNVKAHYLNRCIRSVLFQSYPHWELCLADDCSTQPHVRELLEYWAKKDKRIKITFLEKNQGISGATNAAAALASGDYYAFLDNDDELVSQSLFKVVQQINNSDTDLIYSDEELVDHDGRRVHVFHKPGFNKELLYCHNYITHFVVTKAQYFKEVGGLDHDKSGAQDFDFILKLSEKANNIVHIPEPLYKWRATETSTTINHDSKGYADDAGKRAVEDALARQQESGKVTNAEWKFYYNVQREIGEQPLISVICDCYGIDDTDSWLNELKASIQYENLEFLVISDQTIECCNQLIEKSNGEYLLFLNSYSVPEENLIEGLLEYAQADDIGLVCSRKQPVQENNYRISVSPDLANRSGEYFAEFFQLSSVHMSGLQWSQDVLVCSLDTCMIRKSHWKQVGGVSKNYESLLYSGLDMSLKLHDLGYRNIYSANSVVRECGTSWYQSFDPKSVQRDLNLFKKYWLKEKKICNPYYNTNVLDDFGINLDDFYAWYC